AAIGIAIAGSVLAAGYSARIDSATTALPPPLRAAFEDSLAAASQAAVSAGPMAAPALDAAKDAFVHGCATGAFVLAVISAASALTVAIWAPGRARVTRKSDRVPPTKIAADARSETGSV
ncbi:MFS transporter, partial [Mycolicibacterium fortuitum]